MDNRHKTARELQGEKKTESEVEAQASVYVILSTSWSSIKGLVGEQPISLDRQVCITFVISGQYIYEIVYGWIQVCLAAHFLQI